MAICLQCLHLWDVEKALPALEHLGAKRARVYSTWALSETEKGHYHFEWLDSIIDRMLSYGMKPYLSLTHGNPLYSQKSQEIGGIGHFPLENEASFAAYVRYAGKLAEHFKGRVDTFEIFNEPDCVGEAWIGDADENSWHVRYNKLFVASGKEILRVNPQAKLVWGAVAHPLLDSRFSHAFDDSEVQRLISVIAYHDYKAMPEQMDTLQRGKIKDYIRQHLPEAELWMDEAGIPSELEPGTIGALAELDHLTEKVQAIWLARRMLNYLSDDLIEMVAYFRLYDHARFDNYVVNHYGLMREDYSRKPAFKTFSILATLFGTGMKPFTGEWSCDVENEESFFSDEKHEKRLHRAVEAYEAETLQNTKMVCFELNKHPVLFYWNLCQPNHCFENGRIRCRYVLDVPFEEPVALDVITGFYYNVKQSFHGSSWILHNLPYTNYPFAILNRQTLEKYTLEGSVLL